MNNALVNSGSETKREKVSAMPCSGHKVMKDSLFFLLFGLLYFSWKNNSRLWEVLLFLYLWIPSVKFEYLNQPLWRSVCMSWHLSTSRRRTSYITPISLCVCILNPLSLLGNGSINTFSWQRIYATIKEWLEASFSIRPMSYQMTVCGSVRESMILINASPRC
jgi:hypothetical protein